jgi:hypothetical protein
VTTLLVPGLAIAIGLAAVGAAAMRWRRRRPRGPAAIAPAGAAPGTSDTARLDDDMGTYDL